MPQYTVPQFIEHKAKIVGPLTFQQFIYVGTAGGFCFMLYFTLPLFFFLMASAVIFFFAILLAFGKSGGRPLPLVLKNLVFFTMAPKIYLWKKKVSPPLKLIEAKKPETPEIRESPVPTMTGKSRLKDLSSQVEMRK